VARPEWQVHAFGALTGYSKSYNAFEVKSRRTEPIGQAAVDAVEYGTAEPPERILVTPDDIANFVGFTVGFFDYRNTFTQPIVLYAAIADQFGDIEEFRKGPDITDDRQLVADYCNRLENLISWSAGIARSLIFHPTRTMFILRPTTTRPSYEYRLMYKASGGAAKIGRRSLDSVSRYMGELMQRLH